MRRELVVVVLGFVSGACRPPPLAPADTAVRVPPTPAATAREQAPPRRSLTNELADNHRELLSRLEAQGWIVNRTIEIDRGPAVVVVSEPGRGDAEPMVSRVDVAGPGASRELFRETSVVDLVRHPVDESLVWDLRGDGGKQVVVTLVPCGANCGLPEFWVLELGDDGPREMSPAPPCPSCVVGKTADGVPVLVEDVELTIASCARVSCGPTYALSVTVPKLLLWDGSRFSDTAAALRPVYESRHRERAVISSAAACPVSSLQAAAELYFQLRVLGMAARDARRAVDREYPPRPMSPCLKTHALLSTPRSWDALLDELEGVGIPVLEE